MRDLIDWDEYRWFVVADGVYVYADTWGGAEWRYGCNKNLLGGFGAHREFVSRQFGPVTEVDE